jgi:hypothetical protein
MANSPSSNTTVLASNGYLPPPNHLPVTLLFAKSMSQLQKQQQIIINITNFNWPN